MVSPLFSIITPCYNAEKYLSETIKSILKQTVRNWELLLVDDGSTDATATLCDRYACRDNRIRVIKQKNGGVSNARNHGLDEAKGEWVIFIDADDWFTNNAFEIYKESIKSIHADRFVFNRYYYKNGKASPIAHLTPDKLVRRKAEVKNFLIDMVFPYFDYKKNGVVTGGIRGVNCSLYRRELIESYHIRFEEGIKIAEDALFNYDVMSYAREVTMINEMVGFYRINDTSVMHKFTPNIDEINNETLCGYKKRIGTLLDNDMEFRIAWLGLISESAFRALKLKYLHSEYKASLNERKKQFMKWFGQDVVQKGLDYNLISNLPLGKRQMMQCFSNNIVTGGFLIAYLSIQFLKMRKKI